MGNIIVLPETTANPITLIGERAGICWNADISDPKKNYQRGMDCITSNHGRVLEYVNVEIVIRGYSARVIREWYTHLGGAPTRLQESTRRINYEKGGGFKYVVPPSIESNPEAKKLYEDTMAAIRNACRDLEAMGVPREDSALCLPLGMTSDIVDKRNLRNYVDMSRQRMCSRAYHEYRKLFGDIGNALRAISPEWEWIVDNLFAPKCEVCGYCTEKESCGRKPKKA